MYGKMPSHAKFPDDSASLASVHRGHGAAAKVSRRIHPLLALHPMASKPIRSPVPAAWYPTLAFLALVAGLVGTATFFIYEATSSRRNRRLSKEIMTGAVLSVFLVIKGFGSLFLLLASGVHV